MTGSPYLKFQLNFIAGLYLEYPSHVIKMYLFVYNNLFYLKIKHDASVHFLNMRHRKFKSFHVKIENIIWGATISTTHGLSHHIVYADVIVKEETYL